MHEPKIIPQENIKKIKAKSIISKSNLPASDYCINPYVGCPHSCQYCYASFMKRFTNHPEPWGSFLDVKEWEQIKEPNKYDGKTIFIGSVTDPYNPYEEYYERTKLILEQLKGSKAKINITTKSDLILRDLDLIKNFKNICVAWSINTLDENFKNEMDRAVSIERRLNAMKVFHDAGICTVCFISPIFPGITDVKAIINRVKNQCSMTWLENLNLRGDYKIRILDYVQAKHPELYPLYDAIYNHNDMTYWRDLDQELQNFARKTGLDYITNEEYNAACLSKTTTPTIVNFFYHEEIKK